MVTPRPSRFPPFRAAGRCFSVYSTQVRQGRVELRTCSPCHPLVPFTQVPSRIFLRSMDSLKGRGLSAPKPGMIAEIGGCPAVTILALRYAFGSCPVVQSVQENAGYSLFPPPGAVRLFVGRVWLRSKDCRNLDCPAHAANRSPERAEELAHVADEKVRGHHGGEMAAAFELRPVL